MNAMKSVPKQDINDLLQIRDCGIADYREILQLQQLLRTKRQQNEIPNTVLIVEHPAVITLGARDSANKMIASQQDLKKNNIDLVKIRRGGGATAHNPGQIVFYPITNLKQLDLGINEYIRIIEEIGRKLLENFGLQTQQKKKFPGLWIGEKKIASIGVRVSKFITFHGMALNINNDLSIFDNIVPCGLDDVEMTSLFKETGRKIPMSKVKKTLLKLLIKHFAKNGSADYKKYW